jgi:hypothetical protein
MQERGGPRVLKYSPQLEEAFHRWKQPVWLSWRMDETYRYYLENNPVTQWPTPARD